MAFGVSIIAQRRVRSGAPFSRSTRAACMIAPGPSTLGKRIASGPAPAAAIRSSGPHGVCGPLTRMTTSRPPKSPLAAATTCAARGSLASGATESSRSRISASAGRVARLGERLGVGAGHVEDAAARASNHEGLLTTRRAFKGKLAAAPDTAMRKKLNLWRMGIIKSTIGRPAAVRGRFERPVVRPDPGAGRRAG